MAYVPCVFHIKHDIQPLALFLTVFSSNKHSQQETHPQELVKWLRCDVMLMMWIGIWTFFRAVPFSKHFRLFFLDCFFSFVFSPFYFLVSNSICLTSKKKPLFTYYGATANVHVNVLMCIVQSPLLTFILIIRFVCVRMCTKYLSTLILHITNIMYWLLQTFVIMAEEKEKNHTRHQQSLFAIHSNEKRKLVHVSMELFCVCLYICVCYVRMKALLTRKIFIKKHTYANVCLYCCTLCTHTAWYIFVHWVWVYIRCFCVRCFFFGCRKLHEEWWWFPLLNSAVDFPFFPFFLSHIHFFSIVQPITVPSFFFILFDFSTEKQSKPWALTPRTCTRTLWKLSKSVIMWCIVFPFSFSSSCLLCECVCKRQRLIMLYTIFIMCARRYESPKIFVPSMDFSNQNTLTGFVFFIVLICFT